MTAHSPGGGRLDLDGAWRFAVTDRAIDLGADPEAALRSAGCQVMPAWVPGNLELDLARNGLIDDPFVGMNIVDLRRYETAYAYYLRSFQAPAHTPGSPVLIFEGLDCDARIVLNGVTVARTENMLIEHRVPVGDVLRVGATNLLVVELSPLTARAAERADRFAPGLQAEGGSYAGLRVRKAPHMFGWDIMPRALSAGIWRSVSLRFEPDERIRWLWMDTLDIADDHATASLVLHHDIRMSPSLDPCDMVVTGRADGSTFEHRSRLLSGTGQVRIALASPRLWWPRGRGTATLYDVTVAVERGGSTIDRRTFRHGVRTVRLERSSVMDADGNGTFRFLINDEPVFILGTNWVPLDAYHSRDLDRLPQALNLVDEVGCNLIRCWGGNVYEHDRFFDWCDEAGVLVWQDFAMACAIYPQDETFQGVIRDEVRSVVRRLRQHPSLVVWAGDNECDEQYVWKARRRDPNENVLTRQVIPAVLREEDPSRPYLPSSPYVDDVAYASGGRSLPEDHLWGPRDDYRGPSYRDAVAVFASEIGYFGSPSVETLREFLTPGHRWPPDDNPEWLLHATSPFPDIDTHDYRVPLIVRQVEALFGVRPSTLVDFIDASQAAQAEALKAFIERFRARKWRTTGIIWWNLLDGWPQFSDAIVDYSFRKKLAFEVVRRAQAPVLLIVDAATGGQHDLLICNDTRDDHRVQYEVRDAETGTLVAAGASVARADSVEHLGAIALPSGQAMYALSWASALGHGRSHFLAGEPPFELVDYRRWARAVGLRAGAARASRQARRRPP
jgi:beta-mannosidase